MITGATRIKVYKKCNGRCAYCGTDIEYKEMQIDHIVSISRNGPDQKTNLLPACRSCNASKATYTIREFRQRLIEDVNRLHRDSAKFRILMRFGIVKQTKTELVFYFESC
jgi:5-methylcytosine-specific restriction endonuclease McrA